MTHPHSVKAAAPRERMTYLDMTKGFLVLLMVVYHGLNYTNQYFLSFRYLSFLPLSFILITGFLLSRVYAPRFRAGDRRIVPRLLIRGAKLLLLFTALNVLAQFVRSPAYGKSIGVEAFFANWDQIYLVGSGRTAVFEVLLPIAYLLLLAPFLIWLAQRGALLLPLLTAALLAGCAGLDWRGGSFANLNLLVAGMVGMVAGQFEMKPAVLSRLFPLSLFAYGAYFPLGRVRGHVFVVQLLGAGIALALISGLSVKLGEAGWSQRRLIRLGQYSLLAYIVQIAILQTLSRFLGRPDPLSPQTAVLLFGTLALMTLIVEASEWLRHRSRPADQLYKAVFA